MAHDLIFRNPSVTSSGSQTPVVVAKPVAPKKKLSASALSLKAKLIAVQKAADAGNSKAKAKLSKIHSKVKVLQSQAASGNPEAAKKIAALVSLAGDNSTVEESGADILGSEDIANILPGGEFIGEEEFIGDEDILGDDGDEEFIGSLDPLPGEEFIGRVGREEILGADELDPILPGQEFIGRVGREEILGADELDPVLPGEEFIGEDEEEFIGEDEEFIGEEEFIGKAPAPLTNEEKTRIEKLAKLTMLATRGDVEAQKKVAQVNASLTALLAKSKRGDAKASRILETLMPTGLIQKISSTSKRFKERMEMTGEPDDDSGAWAHKLNPLYWLKSKEERKLEDLERRRFGEDPKLKKAISQARRNAIIRGVGEEETALANEGGACERAALRRRSS